MAACQTHSVYSYSIVTIAVYFALLLCSANQACTLTDPGAGVDQGRIRKGGGGV